MTGLDALILFMGIIAGAGLFAFTIDGTITLVRWRRRNAVRKYGEHG